MPPYVIQQDHKQGIALILKWPMRDVYQVWFNVFHKHVKDIKFTVEYVNMLNKEFNTISEAERYIIKTFPVIHWAKSIRNV